MTPLSAEERENRQDPPPTAGIRAHRLTRRYGMLTAIDDVTFSIPHGEVVGFLGPNGAGKSTTLRILAGLLPASAGEAWIGEISVARHPMKAKHRVGYMPENNPLPEEMRVADYLNFRGRLKNLRGKNLKRRVAEVMDLCDLQRKARRKIIGTLSKGFRQRVGLADALIAEPAVLLLDEPTIGLDPHQIRAVRELIAGLQGNMTVLLSSHILSEIEANCDRVIIINHGQIVAQGTPENLRETFFAGSRYLLEIRGDAERAKESLARPDLEVQTTLLPGQTDHFQLEVTTRSREDLAPWIVERIQNAGQLTIHRLEPVIPALEDIFLAATRRAWLETQEPASPETSPTDT